MKITKNTFLKVFSAIVVLLFLIKLIFPGVAKNRTPIDSTSDSIAVDSGAYVLSGSSDTSSVEANKSHTSVSKISIYQFAQSRFFNPDGSLVKNRIYSVPNFGKTFPDQNDVQLIAAQQFGVKPILNRDEAVHQKDKLVYVGSNPYFYIDKLHSSIPYLVPRASVLLQDIGRSFYDSLQCKGIPLHKVIITSVLRSKDDVSKLRTHNGNATQNSCHMYGTTFDLCYNRYKTVEAPGKPRRKVRNDTLKWVLSEVLRDFREKNRCYIKYEVHQGCFHITVR
ncbi:DUF5715 family protein [Segatella albensis]|jgi:hypothetical protein|uniref:DUF5715 family protein n=1 Tax=Segatella albensis TaxID=77768 RepID=UPI00040B61B2|nr:DUF5715 family protein [Segatella albensis]